MIYISKLVINLKSSKKARQPNLQSPNKAKIIIILLWLSNNKAKYYVIEPYYMEGSTPDNLTVFVSEPKCQRR